MDLKKHLYDTIQSYFSIIKSIVFEDPLAFIQYLQLDLVSKRKVEWLLPRLLTMLFQCSSLIGVMVISHKLEFEIYV